MQVNERWNKIKAANLCACCLRPGHRAIACRSKKACGEDGCDKVHHQLLHNLRSPQKINETSAKNVQSETSAQNMIGTTESHGLDFIEMRRGKLQGIPLKISNVDERKSAETVAFLDQGSRLSFITRRLADKLKLSGPKIPLCLKTMTGQSKQFESEQVSITVSGVHHGAKKFEIQGVQVLERIDVSALSQDAANLIKKYPYINGIPLPSFNEKEPDILLGGYH